MKTLEIEISNLLDDTNIITRDIMKNRKNAIVDMLVYEKLDEVVILKNLSKEQLVFIILNQQSTLESIWEEVENAVERLEEE